MRFSVENKQNLLAHLVGSKYYADCIYLELYIFNITESYIIKKIKCQNCDCENTKAIEYALFQVICIVSLMERPKYYFSADTTIINNCGSIIFGVIRNGRKVQ